MLICSKISTLFQKNPASSFRSPAPLQQAQIIAHYWMHHNGAFRDGIRVSINLEISSLVQRAAYQPCRHKETFEICTCAASPNAAFITLFPSPPCKLLQHLQADRLFHTGSLEAAVTAVLRQRHLPEHACVDLQLLASPPTFPKSYVHKSQSKWAPALAWWCGTPRNRSWCCWASVCTELLSLQHQAPESPVFSGELVWFIMCRGGLQTSPGLALGI